MADPMRTTFLNLIEAVQEGSMSVSDFSSAVEHEWNFGDERATLAEPQKAAVRQMFDVVVYYSPYPDERARIPNYRDEKDVLQAARQCRQSLEAHVR
ncbi:MAG: hypothetical protein KJ690_03565 [Alphaproteobacteria bacterium]|nr:hypothetical protein [Alphaproteobacteria bacterium]